jgi:transcriptional regulator with XRE-family HTH domain
MNQELVTLGQNIRTVRQSLKISQEALAERSGLHRTYICDVERGRRNLSFCSLLMVARGLGSTVSELTRNVESDVGPQLEASDGGFAQTDSKARAAEVSVSR